MTGILLLSILFIVVSTVQSVVNTDVSQVIDATTSVVRYSADIKASEIDGEYQLIFQNSWADHLSYLSVTSKGKTLTVLPPVTNGNYSTWNIPMSASTANLKVQAVFTSLLVPYPAEITQMENQLVQLHGNHYFYSPYATNTQKTVVKLASSTIESFTKVPAHSVRGSSIHFGPFKDIQPLEFSPLTVHYVNNYPFAKFSSMLREVEVSHWGNIAIEDIYELQHAGARLKNGFSRFDYQMKRPTTTSPSFRNLIANLPAQANNIYYRDQIGNISTSDIRVNKDGQLDLDIQTRFPIFGGWQTQFYIGFSVPTELALFLAPEKPNTYQLKLSLFSIFKDVWVEDMEMKVILPEGASDIAVSVPYSVEESRSVRYTYLDSKLNGGRPVLVFKAKNLVPEHDQQLIVTYTYPKFQLFLEPLLLVALFFFLFLLASLLARTTGIVNNNGNTNKKSTSSQTTLTEEQSANSTASK